MDIKNKQVNVSSDISAATTSTTASGTRSAPPLWENVPFDVGCARCGHNLHGLTEPKCPACGLEFDWAIAVPIEQLTCEHCGYHLYGLREKRCPECGTSFTWEEALAAHYRRKKPLFEYRWRNQPFRSLMYSWRIAMHPRKLWQMIDIHDPPQMGPLALTVATTAVALLLLAPVFDGLYQWVYLRSIPWRRSPGYSELPTFVTMNLLSPPAYLLPLFAAVWSATSLAALMIFRQSMRLCRVRTSHVLRVWVYATAAILPLIPLFRYVCVYTRVRIGPWWVPNIEPYVAVFLLAFVIWSLRQGYRHYLRMPHSLGVAIASQIIAILGTAVILIAIPYLAFGLWF